MTKLEQLQVLINEFVEPAKSLGLAVCKVGEDNEFATATYASDGYTVELRLVDGHLHYYAECCIKGNGDTGRAALDGDDFEAACTAIRDSMMMLDFLR